MFAFDNWKIRHKDKTFLVFALLKQTFEYEIWEHKRDMKAANDWKLEKTASVDREENGALSDLEVKYVTMWAIKDKEIPFQFLIFIFEANHYKRLRELVIKESSAYLEIISECISRSLRFILFANLFNFDMKHINIWLDNQDSVKYNLYFAKIYSTGGGGGLLP